MPLFAENELLDACRVLFGTEVQLSRDFLFYVQPCGIKSAFRQKAKQVHPDLHAAAAADEYERQTELFREVNEAYKLLDRFSTSEHKRLWTPADQDAPFSHNPTEQQPEEPSTDTADSISLPERYLETGLYLYHRGVITYAEMIEALVWQRRQRPVIGDLAVRWGWLNGSDIQILNRQGAFRGRFGARAVHYGYLTPFQVQVLLRYQRSCQQPFAQYFVEQGILSAAEVKRLMREQALHNSRYKKNNF
ncbi:MAG: J domain-containing protein [Desulfuromonadaceae bacterium]|nr:J domain-containing protein [Desulfuromonas sp.]MDY0184783.1 J domain-containing protein [Desulfuromonadaceae bacterium]